MFKDNDCTFGARVKKKKMAPGAAGTERFNSHLVGSDLMPENSKPELEQLLFFLQNQRAGL